MKTVQVTTTINFPTKPSFLNLYPKFSTLIHGAAAPLWDEINTPDVFLRAKAIADLGYPSAWAVAEITRQYMHSHGIDPKDRHTKHFVGAAICALMELNGYEKTGKKRTVPHPTFTVAEVYRAAAA